MAAVEGKKCRECNGTGERQEGVKCMVCDGSTECNVCNGTGKKPSDNLRIGSVRRG